ncbi:hypothetical protein KY332_04865 [Candidatus Woesearchaeota archaeon]|nr:hypothetical protein [Candidatus Woesearchaeota archaeon]
MLDNKIIKKVNDFVYSKPRTVQEIALLIRKNWRTANNYVEKIAKEEGTISVRTFRGGTRGALKIVYWNNIEKISSSDFQERLFRKIERGRTKMDFSPFDVYQYVDKNKRSAFIEDQEEETATTKQDMVNTFRSAEKQILFFSGNMSWANLKQGKKKIIDILEELAKNKISMKMLTRVDVASIKNLQKMTAINEAAGREAIEIRHCEQPLRSFIVDNKLARFKEIKNPSDYKKDELRKRTFIFYQIQAEEWIEWLQKVFWNLFRTAIPASKRLKDMNSIQNITKSL